MHNKILRYAPSLTGKMHIGNLKILLVNFLLFKAANNNKLIIRYDNTNLAKNLLDSFNNITTILNLFGFDCSEIIYQTQQMQYIQDYIRILIKKQKVFYCICEDRTICSCIQLNCTSGRLVLRITKCIKHDFVLKDMIMGDVNFKTSNMYDLVLTRSNGVPLYNFSTVISDIVSNINLIIRGGDHLVNTWKQIAIYNALEIVVPQYGHLPLVLHENKTKISKSDIVQDNDVISLVKQGYCIIAILNYTFNLLVSHDKILTLEQMIAKIDNMKFTMANQCFSLARIGFFNKLYIKSAHDLIFDLQMYCMFNGLSVDILNIKIIDEIKNRYTTLAQLYNELVIFCDSHVVSYDVVNKQKIMSHYQHLDEQKFYTLEQSHQRYILTGSIHGLPINVLHKYISKHTIVKRLAMFLKT